MSSYRYDEHQGSMSDDESASLLKTVTATFMYIPTLWAVALEIIVLVSVSLRERFSFIFISDFLVVLLFLKKDYFFHSTGLCS